MMRKTLLIAALVAVVAVSAVSDKHARMFEEFKAKYGRQYSTPEAEAKRLAIFVENMQTAERLQAANPLARFGPNEFADLSAAEFKHRHNANKHFRSLRAKRTAPFVMPADKVASTPTSYDWRTKGAVTAVKNQADCGSCWAFSTTGNIEGQWFLAGNTLTSASEQELVSCDTTNDGCEGGLMDYAFEWLVNTRSGEIVTEASYPYVSGDDTVPSCKSDLSSLTVAATIDGHHDIASSESQMVAYLAANGPISIGVDATSWQTYSGGILTDCTSTEVDHGVLAVGYDTAYSTPYWIIKNSWGADWGEEGYIRVEYGTDQCLITDAPSSSLVSGSATPSPGSPSTPSPASPSTPTPSTSDFIQYNCEDFLCAGGCQKNEFAQNTCLSTEDGSAIAVCESAGLKMTAYSTSDCTGTGESEVMPVDECLQDTAGTYIYNVCPSSAAAHAQPFVSRKSSAKRVDLPPALAKKVQELRRRL